MPMSRHEEAVPPELERLIRRCLEKDPDRRWQSALDVRNELELLKQEIRRTPAPTSTPAVETSAPAPAASSGGLGWMVLSGVLAIVALVLVIILLVPGGEPVAVVAETDSSSAVVEPDSIWTFDSLTSDPGMENAPSLSPDGEFIVFSMRSSEREDDSIYLLRVEGKRPIELTPDLIGEEESPPFLAGWTTDRLPERSGEETWRALRDGSDGANRCDESISMASRPTGRLMGSVLFAPLKVTTSHTVVRCRVHS